MKLLLDHNLSHKIPQVISDLFPGSQHVANLGLDRVPDVDVWNFAAEEGFSILSKDSDFHQMSLVKGPPQNPPFPKTQ